MHPASFNAVAMLIGGVVLAGTSLLAGEGLRLPSEMRTWGAIIYLAMAGSVVTFLLYFQLLKTWRATTLSFISVFTPVTALALGYLVLDERPTVWTALGAALVLAGVILSSRGRQGIQ
jgi:drug/metabolite transporter (DMT)-like permease